MAEEKAGLEAILSREVPIRYYGNDDVTGIFADQVVVSHTAGIFTIYFYQMQIPPIIQKEEEIDAEQLAAQFKEVPAKCVARIVLTPILMEQFSTAIQTNITRYNAIKQEMLGHKE